jgi:hypothetical protein
MTRVTPIPLAQLRSGIISRRVTSFHDRKLTRRHGMTDFDLNLTLHLSGDFHTTHLLWFSRCSKGRTAFPKSGLGCDERLHHPIAFPSAFGRNIPFSASN